MIINSYDKIVPVVRTVRAYRQEITHINTQGENYDINREKREATESLKS